MLRIRKFEEKAFGCSSPGRLCAYHASIGQKPRSSRAWPFEMMMP